MTDVQPRGRPVRGPRRYDASGRRQRARETREAVHRAAFELFGEQGYAGTTLGDVAARAGTSVETVRKMGPKRSLLDGARAYGVFGTAELAGIDETEVMRAAAAAESFAEALGGLVDFYATSNPRTASFWLAWQAAAVADPELGESWQAEMASAHDAMRAAIGLGRAKGWLRTDVEDDELAATYWVLVSAETWTRLVVDAGLSDAAYRTWLRRSLFEALTGT